MLARALRFAFPCLPGERAGRRPGPASALALLALTALPAFAQTTTLPGTTIANTALVEFGSPSDRSAAASNEVTLVTRPARSDATLEIIKVTPTGGASTPIGVTQCQGSAGAVTLPAPVLLDGSVVDPSQAPQVVSAGVFHSGEPVFLQVSDFDQNADGRARDRLEVTVTSRSGDTETVSLQETGDNTGVFTGYLPTASATVAPGDCVLQVVEADELSVRYRDPSDNTDVTDAAALVDPLGIVFDSGSGAPINDAVVTLINVATGQPATVFGDDGVSAFPATLVTGGRVTDGGGTVYQFADGRFRFPLIAPGEYRIDVTPPAGYSAPSQTAPDALQTLPGAPYAIVDASFGASFLVSPGPVINIDIPLDPERVELFLQKTTTATTAAPGDFVEYRLVLDNTSPRDAVRDIVLVDTLPAGFRLIDTTVRLGGQPFAQVTTGARPVDLLFSLPDLPASGRHELRYVAEVTSLRAGDEAINVATATGAGGVASNEARASIRLVDDLFADTVFIVGRVFNGDCDAIEDPEQAGVADVRIYLEDGRYAVTDSTGRYHFEGVRPGTHVVQLDTDTVPEGMELAPCASHGFFSGRAYSQFIDAAPGALWRGDFHLRPIPPPTGFVQLKLAATPHDAADEVRYRVDLEGAHVPVSALTVRLMLPDGVDAIADSAQLDGRPTGALSVNGQALSLPLGERLGQWDHVLEFDARIAANALGELTAKAVATFDTPSASRQRTPLTDARFVRVGPASERIEWTFTPRFDTRGTAMSPGDHATLAAALAPFRQASDVHLRVTGHTDNVPIAPENRAEFADNQVLSQARARAVAGLIGEALSLPPDRISYDGFGAARPVADNKTARGRAQNRRVEVMLYGAALRGQAQVTGSGDAPKWQSLATTGATQAPAASAASPVDVSVTDAVDYFADDAWLENAPSDVALLAPSPDANPAIGAIKVAIRHAPTQRVALSLNGAPVSALNFDGVATNRSKTASVSRWRGVDIQPGSNTLSFVVTDADGREILRESSTVHFAGGPVRAVLDAAASRLTADGRTMPDVVLELFDRDGRPARPESVGVYRVDPPYRAMWQVRAERDNALIVVGDRDPVYTVDAQGRAHIALEPTTQSGEVVLRLLFEDGREQEIRAWLAPAARDWIVVGLAEGTAGFNRLGGDEAAAERDGLDSSTREGRVAVYAKGRVRGDHLLTVAYDSDGDEQTNRRFGEIDPDRFYTLYGDITDQRFDAASADKLYARVEKGGYYALYGDYETGLTETELTRYNRTFNGAKAQWQGRRGQVTAFGTRTDQAFIKDELRGDGTSGLYRLSRQPVLVNSEKVIIETRDRFRSERVLSAQVLTRHLDYDIDYLNGTLFFKQPVQARDTDLNPITIVVDYESRDGRDRALTAGLRGSLQLGSRLRLSATALREGVRGGDGDLVGLDVDAQLTDVTRLRAEVAHSDTQGDGDRRRGSAFLVSLEHTGSRLDGRAYVQRQATGFGLGQQRGTETGTHKTGLDGRLRLSPRLSLRSELFRQRGLESGVVRDVAQAEVRYQSGQAGIGAGLRYARDAGESLDADRRSRQAFVQGSVTALDGRLTLRANHDITLAEDDANVDYPARTTVGADWRLGDRATLLLEHEFGDGENLQTDTTRVGLRATPWERARINATVNRDMREYGPRVFANVGLVQGVSLGERWTVDVGVDHSNTLAAGSLDRVNTSAPLASGDANEDFTSTFIGALYRGEHWSGTSRIERRRSDSESRDGFLFGLYREQTEGIGFTADAELFDVTRNAGGDAFDGRLRFGWAYRPNGSRWTLFNRLDAEYRDIEAFDTTPGDTTWKLVNNMSVNRRLRRGDQWSLRYGAKYVRSTLGDDTLTGFSHLLGAQWRHPLSERFDVGVNATVRHATRADVVDYSLGVEAGAAIVDNTWVSVGYNLTGFEDSDFSRAGYTAQGPYVRFRIKADQDSLAAMRRRFALPGRRDDTDVDTP
ncbi:MAG: OmpA family protein [Pseudomonadota bacterium]